MNMLNRDEKAVKNEIMLLMEGEESGVDFGTLLSLLDLSATDRAYLHILLLDLCREGYLWIDNIRYSSMDEMLFFPEKKDDSPAQMNDTSEISVESADTEQINSVKVTVTGTDAKEAAEETSSGEMQKEEGAEILPESSRSLQAQGIFVSDYAIELYEHFYETVKSLTVWTTVRHLLSIGAWPKEACSVLPSLLIEMASEKIVEIRAESDSISGVRPFIRFCAGNDRVMISDAIRTILSNIQQPVMADSAMDANYEKQKYEQKTLPKAEQPDEKISNPGDGETVYSAESEMPEQDDNRADEDQKPDDPEKKSDIHGSVPVITEIQSQTEKKYGTFGAWTVSDDETAVLYCDSNIFYLHNTGIAQEVCWFFASDDLDLDKAIDITLVYNGIEYSGMIRHIWKSRKKTNLFWDDDLAQQLRLKRGMVSPVARFYRLDDGRYELTVESAETVMTDSEKKDQMKPVQAEKETEESGVRGSEETIDEEWQNGSRIPYGYRKTKDGVFIIESEAEVIRAIFKMRERGMILQSIADILNERGIKTATGRQFYPATLTDILKKRKIYSGNAVDMRKRYPAILDEHYLERYNAIADKKEKASAAEVQKKEENIGGSRRIPYGYEYAEKTVRIEPNEAQCVRDLFEKYDSGMLKELIVKELNDRGYRNRNSGKIDNELIDEIIGNRQLYIGANGYPVIIQEKTNEPEFVNKPEMVTKRENEQEENKQAHLSTPENEKVTIPVSQEEIQEEIYRTLYENPGYHSVDGIKSLNGNLNRIADYKIIFNANTLKARNLIDEIITSPPDPIMYLYAAKVQASVQPAEKAEKKDDSSDGRITDDRDIQDFLEYCRTTPMSYAYKMVLILAFMKHADSLGSLHIDNAVQYFRMFYNDRRNKGLRAEKGNTIFADSGASDHMLRRNIIDNPIKALKGGGYFKYDATNQMLIMRYFVWSKLTDSDKEQIVEICLKRLEEYFRDV